MFKSDTSLSDFDPEISAAIEAEGQRQERHIELIASENHTSPLVMEAQGSVLTNKYAEGYPGKRYYGGCEHVDVVEELAISRVKKLYNADYANVQPHSGSQANAAVYMADGGHLTHGASVSFSGRIYNSVQYGLKTGTGEIDYDQVNALAQEHKPKLIMAGFSAYSRVIDWQKFRRIADSIGAYFVVDMAHVSGLIAAGVYPSPVNIADVTTSTTHKTLRGPRGGIILARANPELERKLNFAVFPESQGGPLMHVIAAKAVCFKEAMSDEFKTYQQQVLNNARSMASVFMDRGFDVISNGTDDHLFLLSLIKQDITGKDADAALGRANITVNKNAVPNDPKPPFVTSGLRLGTPAITTRGFKESEVAELTNWMCDILDDIENEPIIAEVQQRVIELCSRFPVYQ